MGHSFGGTIALEYAARYPQHVQKLIILDGFYDSLMTFALWRSEFEQRHPAAWMAALKGPAGERLRLAESQHDTCAIAKAEFATEMSVLESVDNQGFHD